MIEQNTARTPTSRERSPQTTPRPSSCFSLGKKWNADSGRGSSAPVEAVAPLRQAPSPVRRHNFGLAATGVDDGAVLDWLASQACPGLSAPSGFVVDGLFVANRINAGEHFWE